MMIFLLSSGTLPAEELLHLVGQGETIFSISRFYGVTEAELMRVNGITDPSRLRAGSRIIIPTTIDSNLPSTGLAQTLVEHRVVGGDNLYRLARNNGIPLQTLMDINGFAPNHMLRVGDVVRVPAPPTQPTPQNVQTPPPNVPRPPSGAAPTGAFAVRWPVYPRAITYMTGQMGVIVIGEQLEAVRSLTQGNVVSAGPWRKFGRVVIIESPGGYHYMYGGLETLSVSVGDRVTPGMEVGRLGVNSVSEQPHLYFMVFRRDTPIDPALAPRAGTAGSMGSAGSAGNSRT